MKQRIIRRLFVDNVAPQPTEPAAPATREDTRLLRGCRATPWGRGKPADCRAAHVHPSTAGHRYEQQPPALLSPPLPSADLITRRNRLQAADEMANTNAASGDAKL